MINSISYAQNYNLYSYSSRKYNKINHPNINFKAEQTIHKIIPARTFISTAIKKIFAFFNKRDNSFNFEKYFKKISTLPTNIYLPDGKSELNPELLKYARMLDNLSKKQKREFVKTFCKKTGFPNLKKVQKTIDKEILRAVNKTFEQSDAKPAFVAYASSCSVGRGTALPGSDCDGLFIVADKSFERWKVNRFILGEEINQRILETQGSHFPELFSIDDLVPYIKLSNEIFERIKTPQKIKNYEQNLLRSDQDFVKAGEFNIDIASKIINEDTKNMLYLTSFFVEEYRAGHVLLNNLDDYTKAIIEKSAMYKYGNVVRQEGFKNNSKPKWNNRIKMCSKFNFMPDSKKFKICSEILKSSMGVKQNNISGCYEDFDMGNILDLVDMLTSFRKYLK